jgi:hypothetical protein
MAEPSSWLSLITGPIAKIGQANSALLTAINDLKEMKSANKELQDKVIALQLQVSKQADVMLRMMESIDRLEEGLPDKIELQVRREADKHFNDRS